MCPFVLFNVQCPNCNTEVGKRSLATHMILSCGHAQQSVNVNNKCDKCDKQFDSPKKLGNHIESKFGRESTHLSVFQIFESDKFISTRRPQLRDLIHQLGDRMITEIFLKSQCHQKHNKTS